MNRAKKKNILDHLPPSMIRKKNVTIFPEGIIGYLLGPTMAMMANSVLANYFNTYMSNVLNINKWASWFFTWIPVISVVFVVMGNIAAGQLMDRIHSKAGKARPLILLSIPLSVIALLILFVLSPYVNETIPEKQTAALICLSIGYILWFAVAFPLYTTPHAALVNLSTRNSKDRSVLATISNATALAAMGITSMIFPFFLRLLFVYQTENLPSDAVPVFAENGSIDYYVDASGAAIYDGVASYNHWKILILILIVMTVVGAVIEFFFTRERVTEETQGLSGEIKKEALPVKKQAKICFGDRFWIIMIAFFFFYQMGGIIRNISQLYFCQAMFADTAGNYTVAHGGTMQGILAIAGSVPTGLGMLITVPLANKIGKAKAVFYGAFLAVFGGILGMLFPENFTLVLISVVVKAMGSIPAMYLSLALLADILEHQEAENGARTDGFTMSFYGAIMAGMTGVATGILNGVLSALDYSSSNISSPALRSAMPWMFIGIETLCYAAIFAIFFFMKVEKYSEVDRLAILQDQGKEIEEEEWKNADKKLLAELNRRRAANGMKPVQGGKQSNESKENSRR